MMGERILSNFIKLLPDKSEYSRKLPCINSRCNNPVFRYIELSLAPVGDYQDTQYRIAVIAKVSIDTNIVNRRLAENLGQPLQDY